MAGKSIVLPENPGLIKARDLDLGKLRRSLIKNALANTGKTPNEEDIKYLAEETNTDVDFVKTVLEELAKQ